MKKLENQLVFPILMKLLLMIKIYIILLSFFLFGCDLDIKHDYPENKNFQQKKNIGKFFNKEISLYNPKISQKKITREELWNNAIKITKNEGFEIDFIDSNIMLLVTKWFKKTDNLQIKLQIFIKENQKKDFNAENLIISISSKKKENNLWVLFKKENKNTINYLKDKILNNEK